MSESTRQPVVLIIRDGWGENPNPDHDAFNAVKLAETPVADRLASDYPCVLVRTRGEDVGLPPGTMGNSEVGHQNIGAGRIVDQELMRITTAIRSGSFFENQALLGAMTHAKLHNSRVHIMGLVSNGRVHSDLDHLFALIDLAATQKVDPSHLLVHVLTDGRDTGPRTGLGFVEQLEEKLRSAGVGRIASVCGRYFAMDRDHRWDRIARAYACLTGRGEAAASPISTSPSATEALRRHYDSPPDEHLVGDEFMTPTRIVSDPDDSANALVRDGDAVIFFNFRGDRPRQLVKTFVLDDDSWREVQGGGFDRGARLRELYFCGMTEYEAGLPMTAVAFRKPPHMKNILGEVIADAGLTQFRCAETEKFAHVTFFFNDYREEPFPGENRLLCPSPKDVSTYDQKPEMSARDVCQGVLARLSAEDCEAALIVNFANPDMVGHTGSLDAAIRACEVVDTCVGRIVEATLNRGGSLIITADHGNAEQMWNPQTKAPHTAHTTNDVPLYVVGTQYTAARLRTGGRLADIAPTMLAMMNLPQPKEMTGTSLLAQTAAPVH